MRESFSDDRYHPMKNVYRQGEHTMIADTPAYSERP